MGKSEGVQNEIESDDDVPLVKKKRVKKQVKPKPVGLIADVLKQNAKFAKSLKLKKKREILKQYKAQGNLVLKLQKQMGKAKGEKMGRLLRDMEEQIKKGQEMAKLIKAKKYKNTKLNLDFFFQ